MPNTAETLASVVGGGLQGFVQGRQAKMQRENAKARQDRQFKMDQSREERQNQKMMAEQEQYKRKQLGLENSSKILRHIAGINPDSFDMSTSNELKSTFMQEWATAGLDPKTGSELYDKFAASRGVNPPLTAEEQAKTELEKQRVLTEKERTRKAEAGVSSEKALERQRLAGANLSNARAKKLSERLFDKPIEAMSLDELIGASQKMNGLIKGLTDEFGDPLTEEVAGARNTYLAFQDRIAQQLAKKQGLNQPQVEKQTIDIPGF